MAHPASIRRQAIESKACCLVSQTLMAIMMATMVHGHLHESDIIRLPGATGSGAFPVVSQWATAFQAQYPEADLTMDSVGSSGAQKALWGEVDCETRPIEALCNDFYSSSSDSGILMKKRARTVWGIGDAPFEASDYGMHPELHLQQYPAIAGAVVIAYSRDVWDQAARVNHTMNGQEMMGHGNNDNSLQGNDHMNGHMNHNILGGNRRVAATHNHGDMMVEETNNDNMDYSIDGEDHSEHKGHLHLTFDIFAAILNGTIVFWDDPALVELNEHNVLPHEPISVVLRSDPSGQTTIVTQAVKKQVPSWPWEAVGAQPEWPIQDILQDIDDFRTTSSNKHCHMEDDGRRLTDDTMNMTGMSMLDMTQFYGADGFDSVATGLLRVPFSIGYMPLGAYNELKKFLHDAHIATADKPGVFMGADVETISKSVDVPVEDFHLERLDLALAQNPSGGYPASGWAYWYVSKDHSSYESCDQAWMLAKFISWTYTNNQAKRIAVKNGWVIPSCWYHIK